MGPITIGPGIIGKPIFLNCSVQTLPIITNNITLELFKNGSSLIFSNSNSVLTWNISSVSLIDSGMYRCNATLDIDGQNLTANNMYEFWTLG